MLEEIIVTGATSQQFYPNTYIHNSKVPVKFEGNCMKQDKVSFTQKNLVNYFFVYE